MHRFPRRRSLHYRVSTGLLRYRPVLAQESLEHGCLFVTAMLRVGFQEWDAPRRLLYCALVFKVWAIAAVGGCLLGAKEVSPSPERDPRLRQSVFL